MKISKLFNNSSNKSCILTLNGKKLMTENIKNGKSRFSEKEFETEEEAVKQYEKKERSSLKAGFVFKNDNPANGEPVMHYDVGGGFTGALSFADTPDGIFCYKCGWSKTATDRQDFMVRIDSEGLLNEEIALPVILAWDMQYVRQTNSLIMELDHHVYKYDLESKQFNMLLGESNKPIGFIATSKNYNAYVSHPTLKVEDFSGKVIREDKFDVKSLDGSYPFCISFSENGDLLAIHSKQGKIDIIETVSGNVVSSILGDFPAIDQMQFIDDGKIIVIQERHLRIRFYNIETGKEIIYEGLFVSPFYEDFQAAKYTDGFCINADQSLMVQKKWIKMFVFDLKKKCFLHQFELKHCVKGANFKFLESGLLGVRTDWGYFSIYKV